MKYPPNETQQSCQTRYVSTFRLPSDHKHVHSAVTTLQLQAFTHSPYRSHGADLLSLPPPPPPNTSALEFWTIFSRVLFYSSWRSYEFSACVLSCATLQEASFPRALSPTVHCLYIHRCLIPLINSSLCLVSRLLHVQCFLS